MIEKCKELRKKGNILILWTCREGKDLEEALVLCSKQELFFDYVNENTKEYVERYGKSRKVCCDYFIDDKCISFKQFLKL